MKLKQLTIIAFINLFVFTSCTDDNEDLQINSPVAPLGAYENGLLISHEGNFGQGNASVSFVSNNLSTIENTIFDNVNNELLGDTAQSIAFDGDLAYIILNVSNKIEIVNRFTFQTVGTINTGLSNPRYMTFVNDKAYVTNWGDGFDASDDFIAVVDLLTNTVSSTIPVAEGPEQIISKNNMLYVGLEGGFNTNNKVLVIDALNTNSISEITVKDNPENLFFNVNGDLIVLSKGHIIYDASFNIIGHTDGAISTINTTTNMVVTEITFANEAHPNFLTLNNGDLFYYLNGAVFKMDVAAATLPVTPLLTGVSFYGMSVNNNTIYGVDAKDFSSNGALQIFNANTGQNISNIDLSVIPSKVYFN